MTVAPRFIRFRIHLRPVACQAAVRLFSSGARSTDPRRCARGSWRRIVGFLWLAAKTSGIQRGKKLALEKLDEDMNDLDVQLLNAIRKRT